MTRAVMCRHCGAPLQLFKYRAGTANAFSADTLAMLPTADGKQPTLGAHGNNVFCSVRCGFDWAIARLKHDTGGAS